MFLPQIFVKHSKFTVREVINYVFFVFKLFLNCIFIILSVFEHSIRIHNNKSCWSNTIHGCYFDLRCIFKERQSKIVKKYQFSADNCHITKSMVQVERKTQLFDSLSKFWLSRTISCWNIIHIVSFLMLYLNSAD